MVAPECPAGLIFKLPRTSLAVTFQPNHLNAQAVSGDHRFFVPAAGFFIGKLKV